MSEVPQPILDIIRAAAAAPSGDNSQPWRFVFLPTETIEFHLIPNKDNPLLNVDESGTLIALGAAVENAAVMAHSLGYVPDILWNTENKTLVATMRLGSPDNTIDAGTLRLAKAIFERHSNRKTYSGAPLQPDDKKALLSVLLDNTNLTPVFIEKREQLRAISRNLTTMEEVALSNQTIHNLFFKNIFWSQDRNERGEPGLYIDTLELPPPARALFKVLRYWSVARVLSRLGFPRVVAKGNAEQNASASVFVCIAAKQFDRKTFLETGRMLERFWLTATDRRMAFQIVTGLLFLARRAQKETNTDIFTTLQKDLIQKAYESFRILIDAKDIEPVIAFRIGYADKPTAYAHRLTPHIEVQSAY